MFRNVQKVSVSAEDLLVSAEVISRRRADQGVCGSQCVRGVVCLTPVPAPTVGLITARTDPRPD